MKRAHQETTGEGRGVTSRNVSAKVSTEPISINNVESSEAKKAFNDRLEHAVLFMDEENPTTLQDVKAWSEATFQAVEEYPILAHVVDQNGSSLLYFCCKAISGNATYNSPQYDLVEEQLYAADAVKALIEKNPHALVWNIEHAIDPLRMIFNSACLLLIGPWITEQYPWVFQQPAYANDWKSSPVCILANLCLVRSDDGLFSPDLFKNLLIQCPQLISSGVFERCGGALFLLAYGMGPMGEQDDLRPHPELLEFMVRKQPDLALVKNDGISTFSAILLLFLKACERAGTAHNTDDLVESFQFKILKLMLNLCPKAALVPISTDFLPINVLLIYFERLAGGKPVIELIAQVARIMYPNFEESAPADVKDNALMKKVLEILDKEKEAALMSIRLKRSKYIFSKGNHLYQDLYGCWVTNQLIQLKDQIKQYREKDIPALKHWQEEPQDHDGSDGGENMEEEEDDDDDDSSQDGDNDGGDAHEDDEEVI